VAAATDPVGRGDRDVPAYEVHEVVAVLAGAEPARTAAWRLLRAGMDADRMVALGRNGPIELRRDRRADSGHTWTVDAALAAGVLCVSSGLLLFALARDTVATGAPIVVLPLVLAAAGLLLGGARRRRRRGAGGGADAADASPTGSVVFSFQARNAEEAREACTLLRQYGGTAIAVLRIDPVSDRAVGASAG
jgi:hypothetical protein